MAGWLLDFTSPVPPDHLESKFFFVSAKSWSFPWTFEFVVSNISFSHAEISKIGDPMAEHAHCQSCFDRNCSFVECEVLDCENQCGARFHACKKAEHLSLCSRAVVACVNSQHGCPARFARRKQGPHLHHCPANVVFCSHLWFRRNKCEREAGQISSDPPIPSDHLEFAMAFRDQDQVGGVGELEDCSISPRPKQRVCSGVDLIPKSESVETLTEPCFAPGLVVVPELQADEFSSPLEDEEDPVMPRKRVQAQLSIGSESSNCVDLHSDNSGSKEGSSDPREVPKDSVRWAQKQTSIDSQTSGSVKSLGKTTSLALPGKNYRSESETSDEPKPSSPTTTALEADATTPPRKTKPAHRSGLSKIFNLRNHANHISVGPQQTDGSSVSDVSLSSDQEAFQTSMGTKLRSHVQSSRRKIARVLTGKILLRQHANPADATAVRSYKHRLPSSPNDSFDNAEGLEVVTHKDTFIVSDDSPTSTTPQIRKQQQQLHTSMGSHASLSSHSSLPEIPGRLRYMWQIREDRLGPTELFKARQLLDRSYSSAKNKLLLELPLYFFPRHLYPDDGLVQCQCSHSFRRDEIGEHQLFVHAGIDSLLSSHCLTQRCPMAMYGCSHFTSRLAMPQENWKLTLVKGAVATLPDTSNVTSSWQGEDAPDVHLTTLPHKVLKSICSFLDPLALSCLVQTCRHLRQVVSTVISDRGMVEPVWERRETEDGEVAWALTRYRWTLSTYSQGVPLDRWTQTGQSALHRHLATCKLSRDDRSRHGGQWQPLEGLTDVAAVEVVSDSDYEENSDLESDPEAKEADANSNTDSATRSRSSGNSRRVHSSSQVKRRAKTIDEILGDNEIDDIAEEDINSDGEVLA